MQTQLQRLRSGSAVSRTQASHTRLASPTCLIHRSARLRCHSSSKNASQPSVAGTVAASVAAAALLLTGPAVADQRELVGSFTASGFLFKDAVEVFALDDPEVKGVTLYISDFKRSIVDKLSKDFFAEPSQASISCSITGPVSIANPANVAGSEGRELFSEKKGFNLFKDKTLRIRRVFDADRRSVAYVAYSTRLSNAADDKSLSTGRYRTSLCVLHLPDSVAPAVNAAVAAAPAGV